MGKEVEKKEKNGNKANTPLICVFFVLLLVVIVMLVFLLSKYAF